VRPIIGITAGYDENEGRVYCPSDYIQSVVEAGGKPLLIPIMPDDMAEELLSVVDGMLFPGGVDLDPRHYNERPNLQLGKINPKLDKLELAVARSVLKMGMPLLGVCRGCQLVNVAAKGNLVQDIPSQVGGAMKHYQQAPRWYGTHEAVFDEDSLFHRVFGKRRIVVNSFHHQSIKEPGEGFTVTARALDGVAEGAESKKGFRLLIQWHPEGMWAENRIFLEPFKALVSAAKGKEL
jgi:putative glutamine amidotransferase